MRIINLLLAFVLSSSVLFSQVDLSADQWQEDLRFLQKTVHEGYESLFHKITAEEWDAAVDRLHAEIPSMEDYEVVVGLAKIVALFGYGHTYLGVNAWRYNRNAAKFQQMPYNLYQFSDGVHVQGVHKDFEKALGARVLKVGNMTIEEAMKAVYPVSSVENESFFKAYGMYNLGVSEVLAAQGVVEELGKVTLTLEKGGEEYAVEFTPRPVEQFPGNYGLIQTGGDWLDVREEGETPLYLKHLDKVYYYEYLPEHKTVYVRHSRIADEPGDVIPAFYDRVFAFVEENDVERFVLDVRLNGGGNNYKVKPIVTGVIRADKINQAGKFYVITGRRTYSACQNLVNRLENYTNVTFAGEPTGENVNFFGDNRTETLPNSQLPVRLSYLWWQDKDPRDTRDATPPHIAVEMSFDEYRTNQDPVLEAVLTDRAGSEGITDPWVHLSDLFNAGEFDELEKKAKEFVKDPKYRYFDFEERINDAGYQLLNAGMADQAMWAFNLNAEMFPESANCWDSLAESYWKSGKLEKAKELYNKAIEMDPEGPIGENAKKMLEQIERGH